MRAKKQGWNKDIWVTPSDLSEAFVVGVIRADPAVVGLYLYPFPKDFEFVVAYVNGCISGFFGTAKVKRVTPRGIVDLMREWLKTNYTFKMWNKKTSQRNFIDLDSVFQNTMCHLRDQALLKGGADASR